MSNPALQFENPLQHTENSTPAICFYPINHLGVLCVGGADAAQFLQGQCTCDIKTINENFSSFGAFCNAKGRVISTFIATKQADNYLLILPIALLPLVHKRLKLYILRAKVSIIDYSTSHCITGLATSVANPKALHWPLTANNNQNTLISYPSSNPVARFLMISDTIDTESLCADVVNNGYGVKNCADWQFLDIQAGIPWLNPGNSEEYIPQMLNLDQLGGICFNKGCYTGQEIVARTHYLGKSKRSLYIAKVEQDIRLTSDCMITAADNQQKVGSLLSFVRQPDAYHLLIVLNIDAVELPKLYLCSADQVAVQLTVCYAYPCQQ